MTMTPRNSNKKSFVPVIETFAQEKGPFQSFSMAVSKDEEKNEGTIELHGVVYRGAIEEWGEMDFQMLRKAMRKVEGVDVLHVHIHSPGGHVTEGLAMYDELKAHGAKLITYNDGLAASMGSVLFMAGEERVMRPNSAVMVHNPWGLSVGEAKDHQKAVDLLLMQQERIVGIYSIGLGDHDLDIQQMMDDETWIYAETAVADGWAHRIDGEPVLDMAARLVEYGRTFNSSLGRAEEEATRRQQKRIPATDPSRSENDENSIEEKTMTREELIALFNEHREVLMSIVKTSDEFTEAMAEAITTATAEEQQRIQDVLSLSREGVEEYVMELAFADEKHSKAEAAILVLDKIDELGATALDKRRKHKKTVETDGSGDDTDLDSSDDEKRWRAEYEQDVDGCRTRSDGFSSVENYIAYQKGKDKGRVKHNNSAYQ